MWGPFGRPQRTKGLLRCFRQLHLPGHRHPRRHHPGMPPEPGGVLAMIQRRGRDLLRRWEHNPIITLQNVPYQCNTVFNGTPLKFDGEYLLLLRVEGQQGYSFFCLARSDDGFDFRVDERPCMGGVRSIPSTCHPVPTDTLNVANDTRGDHFDRALRIERLIPRRVHSPGYGSKLVVHCLSPVSKIISR